MVYVLSLQQMMCVLQDEWRGEGSAANAWEHLWWKTIKQTQTYCKLLMVADVGSHGRSWWCVAVPDKKWAKEKLQCIKGWYGSRRRVCGEYDVGFDGVCCRRAVGWWRQISHGCISFLCCSMIWCAPVRPVPAWLKISFFSHVGGILGPTMLIC